MYIETKNLILRPFRPNDYLDLYEYLHEPGSPCFIDMKLNTLEDAKKEIQKRIDSKEKTAENSREEADKTSKVKIGIEEIVSQDTSILFDKKYMEAVASVLEKGKKLDKSEIGE